MSIRDLRDIYGEGKASEVVNRAVRAELIGGNEILDAAALLSQATHKFRVRGLPETEAAEQAKIACDAIRHQLTDKIADRYDLRRAKEPKS